MIEIVKTATFDRWFRKLRDPKAKACIAMRLRRLSLGNAGDIRPIGHGLSEIRVDYTPAYSVYCVYFIRCGVLLVLLLCGGEKQTEQHDIQTAAQLAAKWRDGWVGIKHA